MLFICSASMASLSGKLAGNKLAGDKLTVDKLAGENVLLCYRHSNSFTFLHRCHVFGCVNSFPLLPTV